MELHDKPIEQVENKFVITEEKVYFLPCSNREETPWFTEIVKEIFDLDDPEVSRRVEERVSQGKIIMGYYDPSTEEIEVHLPLEPNDYIKNRINVVFGKQAI